jgi:hypothetical protein
MTWYPLYENHLRTEKERADLRLRLLDAVMWSLQQAEPNNPRTCLRTEEFRPYIFNDSRHATVRDVISARHEKLVEGRKIPDVALNTNRDDDSSTFASLWNLMPAALGYGRLLVWERDSTVDDGVGEFVTKGYLDASDMPPWDTWVTYVSPVDDATAQTGYLLSWVPPAFVPSVADAVAANAYGALYWLAGTRLLLSEILGEIGWLR